MTVIFSLSKGENGLWASGPAGLYLVEAGKLQAVPQPQQHLHCSVASGHRVLVGGIPHGVAFSPDDGRTWQAAWMDGVGVPALCLAPDVRIAETGVILAGTAGAGILRTTDRGWHWSVCNFGLQDFTILAITWAPPAPANAWPQWETVFAATEEGLYRSPNGGLGWRRCTGVEGPLLALAVAPDFHVSGLVLAGTEAAGLARSSDGGRHFEPVAGAPLHINALISMATGWLLSDEFGLWSSVDGLAWKKLPNSNPALTLLETEQGIWAGTENGVELISELSI